MMMAIPGTETMRGEEIMTGTERIGIDIDLSLALGVDLSTNQSQDLVLVHAQKVSHDRPDSWYHPAIPGMFPNMFPSLASGQFGALAVMPIQAMTQQAGEFFRSALRNATAQQREVGSVQSGFAVYVGKRC